MSGHTKGPWAAASKASSVVGLPVVSQSGRSIASITFFGLGEPFEQHDRESYANAHLIAASPDMYEALRLAVEEIAALRAHAAQTGVTINEIEFNEGLAALAKAEGRL